MNLKTLKTEQVKNYIQAEHAKGRPMREIVQEVAAVRSDFTILSPDPKTSEQQVREALS